MGEIMTFEPTEAQFGVFWKYLQRPNVTDVDYNGSELWITDFKLSLIHISCGHEPEKAGRSKGSLWF